MSRDSSTFKEGYNQALDLVRDIGVSGTLPTESALSETLCVSPDHGAGDPRRTGRLRDH